MILLRPRPKTPTLINVLRTAKDSLVIQVSESLQMFDDIVTNVVIPSAEKKQSLSNLKAEIKLTLEDVQNLGKQFINKATVFSTDPLGMYQTLVLLIN